MMEEIKDHQHHVETAPGTEEEILETKYASEYPSSRAENDTGLLTVIRQNLVAGKLPKCFGRSCFIV